MNLLGNEVTEKGLIFSFFYKRFQFKRHEVTVEKKV